MTFMEGHKITRKELYEAEGVRAGEVAARLVQAFYKMLFATGSSTPIRHPGNFLVEPRGQGKFRLVVLDFGAICVAKPALIDGMMEILQGAFTQDNTLVVKGFRRMGFVAAGANEALLERTVARVLLEAPQDPRPHPGRAHAEQAGGSSRSWSTPRSSAASCRISMRSVEYPEEWF